MVFHTRGVIGRLPTFSHPFALTPAERVFHPRPPSTSIKLSRDLHNIGLAPEIVAMSKLIVRTAFALPLVFGAPRAVDAEGLCPPPFDVYYVPPGWPADHNDNGIVCGKVRHGKPDDGYETLFMIDDH